MTNLSTKGTRKIKIFLSGVEVTRIRWRKPATRKPNPSLLDPCCYCGTYKPNNMTWEHIFPRKHGGKNGWENKARACRRCNVKRDTKPLLQFIISTGGLK